MRDHAEIEQLLAIRALDGLDNGDDARLSELMASHGDCDECRDLERGSAEAAAALAGTLEPVPLPEDLEERTLVRARLAHADASAAADTRPRLLRSAGSRPSIGSASAWVRGLAAAAAAIVLFGGGWLLGSSTGASEPPFPPTDARVATFDGTGTADLALVYRPGGTGVLVVGSGLDRPADGRTYELWLFRGRTPVSAGCFEPSSAGGVVTFVDMPVGPTTRAAAVTEEPTACPSAPTSQPILTASL